MVLCGRGRLHGRITAGGYYQSITRFVPCYPLRSGNTQPRSLAPGRVKVMGIEVTPRLPRGSPSSPREDLMRYFPWKWTSCCAGRARAHRDDRRARRWSSRSASSSDPVVGHVYVDGNTAGANTVDAFARHADGTLTPLAGLAVCGRRRRHRRHDRIAGINCPDRQRSLPARRRCRQQPDLGPAGTSRRIAVAAQCHRLGRDQPGEHRHSRPPRLRRQRKHRAAQLHRLLAAPRQSSRRSTDSTVKTARWQPAGAGPVQLDRDQPRRRPRRQAR